MLGFRLPFARRKGYGMGAAGGGNEGAPGDPAFVFDQFTDANGTALASHAISPTNTPATSWAVKTSSFNIQSNKANKSGAGDGTAYTVTGVADCTVSADVTSSVNSAGVGLAVRCKSGDEMNNQFHISWIPMGGANGFIIEEVAAGAWTIRANSTVNYAASTTHAIVATLSGSTISATLDGANSISYGSATANQTSVRHGLFSNAGANVPQFDNFTVQQ